MNPFRSSARRRLRVEAGALVALLFLAGGTGPEAPVADAAMQENVVEVRALLKRGADVNAAHGDGMTALHWAASHGSVELTDMLLYAGANPASTTRLGPYTPLMIAAKGGHGEVVERLLEGGAPMTGVTSTGVTALHLAVASGSTMAVAALLDRGAPVDAMESAWNQTPLMWAADEGHAEVVSQLILAGADVSAMERVSDLKALEEEDAEVAREHNARVGAVRAQRIAEAQAANPELAAAAAEAEAAAAAAAEEEEQPEEEAPEEDEEEEDDDSSEDGDEEEEDEDPMDDQPLGYTDMVGGHGGLNALHHAVREGHRDAAIALLDAGADLNETTGGDGSSPLVLATINGHFDLALELIERGADVNVYSDGGVGPLFAAINLQWAPKALYPQPTAHRQQEVSHLDFMRAVLDAGADVNARVNRHIWFMSYNFDLLGVSVEGATPFWRAAYGLDVPAMKLLMEYGADPEIATRKGPERRRFRGGEEEQEEDPSGLDPIPVGGPAVYPIHAASGVGHGAGYAGNAHQYVPDGWVPAVKYLIEELGADVNARDHQGYTPLHHAASRGDTDLINYLVEMGADVTVVSRRGQTTADMANGPVQRVSPYPEAVALLESLGSENNDNCVGC